MKHLQSTTSLTDKSLPHCEDTERAVIGALLISSTAIGEVATVLSPEVFYNSKHAKIYNAIYGLYNEGLKIDMLTVCKSLLKSGELESIGGPFEISQLSSGVGSAANVSEHARLLHQLWLSREMVLAGMQICAEASDETADISETITNSLRLIENISGKTEYCIQINDVSCIARKCVSLYELRKQLAAKGIAPGIPTGINKLDLSMGGGLKPGQLIILAARPGVGKTSVMLHLCKSAAMSQTPVAIFSLEMGAEELTNRLLLSECNIDPQRFKLGQLSEAEEQELCEASDRIARLPICIDGTPAASMAQIKAKARNLQRKGKCGLIAIDYLQLLDIRCNNKSYNKTQELGEATRSAKLLAKELQCPVILLSQLNRAIETRADKRPLLSDLRDSGSIEQDADIVLFIDRPELHNVGADQGVGILSIAKQRDGVMGDIRFRYNPSLTQISDY